MRALAQIAVVAVVALVAAPALADEALRVQFRNYVAFAAGRPLDDATRRALDARVDAQAAQKPAEVDGLKAVLAKIEAASRAAPDDLARAKIRSTTMTAIYWDTKSKPDPVSDLIVEAVGVVAADPATRLIVRDRDIEGFCASAAIAAMGRPFEQGECRKAAKAAVRNFASMPADQRRVVADGERRAAALAAFWRGLDEKRRAVAFEQAKKSAGSDEPMRVGRALETAALAAGIDRAVARSVDATSQGLVKGATANAVGGASRGF